MINPDELEPQRTNLKPPDLQQLSVRELNDYIVALKAEIKRAEDVIAKKSAHKDSIDALFGGTKN
ncbi:MAG: DUF1192 domain-containing protein [Alphaproteobacteria bacterium]